MAWISVYQQIKGKKLRELRNALSCSSNEVTGMLVNFWLWALDNAERDGKLSGITRSDLTFILSDGLSCGLSADNALDSLISCRWIDEIDSAFYIHDWDFWQKEWFKALDRRDADAARQREKRNREKQDCPQDCPPDCPQENPHGVHDSPSPSPSPSPNRKQTVKEDTDMADKPPKRTQFIPPTVEEIHTYCVERNNGLSAQKIFDHYEANNWYRGKTKIKDWKACVRTWENNSDTGIPKTDNTKKEIWR